MSYEIVAATNSPENRCLNLSGELCIFNAADLKEHLLGILAEPGPCTLDLSQVGEADTAGLQLLLFARREANNRELDLRLTRPSETLMDAARLLGVAVELGFVDGGVEQPEE